MTGQPPPKPLRRPSASSPDFIASILSLPVEERENAIRLISLYTGLSPENRKLVLGIASSLPKSI
jgi:hypothetical protein